MIFSLIHHPDSEVSYLVTKNEDESESLASMIQSAFPNDLIGIACYNGYYDSVVISAS